MLSFLLICLTCVTAEAILGEKLADPSQETYTKCKDAVTTQIWKEINDYQCKAISTATGKWCCDQCNVEKRNITGDDNDCNCEVIPDPKPKVTCPADFPLCLKSNGDCTTHVGGHLKKMTPGCTYSYVRAKCTQKFPICYKDGDCVLQACKKGVQEGTNCERWQSGHNYISLIFREGQDKTPCSDDYFPEVYYEKRGTNLDSVKGRPSGGGNPTDLVACNPGQLTSGAAVDFCKNMCSNFFNCGGFTIHGNQIMLKRIVLKEGVLDDMVFEHQDYFIDRTGFTTYYLKTPGSKIEQTTSELRELFA